MRFFHSRDANATVEFAIVLPLLIVMVLGILDIGRALNAYATVRNAGSEAAHWATLHPAAAPEDVADAVRARVVPLDASLLTVAVQIDDGTGWQDWPAAGIPRSTPARLVPVLVEVSYPWSAVTVIASFFPDGAGATFRSRTIADALR